MPNSLTKTTLALLLAAVAVLVASGISMRDFIRDVSAPCPGTFETVELGSNLSAGIREAPVFMQTIDGKLADVPAPEGARFRLVSERDEGAYPARYRNVRVEWLGDGTCVCGSVPILVMPGDNPFGLKLTRDPATSTYFLSTGTEHDDAFRIDPAPSHRMQPARIFTRNSLSLAVSFAAFLALGVAWLRQRKARAYALVMHEWRQAELTQGQMIQTETGEMLGALQSTSRRIWQRAGKVLVAPEALGVSGLYRDVPVIEPNRVARGTHAEWTRATMIRLRDARAIAILSTLTSAIALAAHLYA